MKIKVRLKGLLDRLLEAVNANDVRRPSRACVCARVCMAVGR